MSGLTGAKSAKRAAQAQAAALEEQTKQAAAQAAEASRQSATAAAQAAARDQASRKLEENTTMDEPEEVEVDLTPEEVTTSRKRAKFQAGGGGFSANSISI